MEAEARETLLPITSVIPEFNWDDIVRFIVIGNCESPVYRFLRRVNYEPTKRESIALDAFACWLDVFFNQNKNVYGS